MTRRSAATSQFRIWAFGQASASARASVVFPGLTGPRKKDHLAAQVGLDEGGKRAFHADYFAFDWKKVKTIFQSTGK
jgi:hypothetical protein